MITEYYTDYRIIKKFEYILDGHKGSYRQRFFYFLVSIFSFTLQS